MSCDCINKTVNKIATQKYHHTTAKLGSRHHRCSIKKPVFKNLCWGSLFNKVAGVRSCNFIKETTTQLLSREYCKICESTFSKEHLRTTASVSCYHSIEECHVFWNLSNSHDGIFRYLPNMLKWLWLLTTFAKMLHPGCLSNLLK